jgi:hypothetical protein
MYQPKQSRCLEYFVLMQDTDNRLFPVPDSVPRCQTCRYQIRPARCTRSNESYGRPKGTVLCMYMHIHVYIISPPAAKQKRPQPFNLSPRPSIHLCAKIRVRGFATFARCYYSPVHQRVRFRPISLSLVPLIFALEMPTLSPP